LYLWLLAQEQLGLDYMLVEEEEVINNIIMERDAEPRRIKEF